MRVSSSYVSDVGRVRTNNEDGYFATDVMRFYAVADGMGGHAAGEVASAIALKVYASEALVQKTLGPRFFKDVFQKSHDAVLDAMRSDPKCDGMGTTLAACSIVGKTMHGAHVGDSVIVLVPGSDRAAEIRVSAASGSTSGRVLQLVAGQGVHLTESHAGYFGLSDYLGCSKEHVPYPDVFSIRVEPGDVVVLATDGVTNYCDPRAIGEIVLEHSSEKRARALVDAALAAGGEDNATAVVVNVG